MNDLTIFGVVVRILAVWLCRGNLDAHRHPSLLGTMHKVILTLSSELPDELRPYSTEVTLVGVGSVRVRPRLRARSRMFGSSSVHEWWSVPGLQSCPPGDRRHPLPLIYARISTS